MGRTKWSIPTDVSSCPTVETQNISINVHTHINTGPGAVVLIDIPARTSLQLGAAKAFRYSYLRIIVVGKSLSYENNWQGNQAAKEPHSMGWTTEGKFHPENCSWWGMKNSERLKTSTIWDWICSSVNYTLHMNYQTKQVNGTIKKANLTLPIHDRAAVRLWHENILCCICIIYQNWAFSMPEGTRGAFDWCKAICESLADFQWRDWATVSNRTKKVLEAKARPDTIHILYLLTCMERCSKPI